MHAKIFHLMIGRAMLSFLMGFAVLFFQACGGNASKDNTLASIGEGTAAVVFAPPGLGVRDFGDRTRGGLDGSVLRVTNLNGEGQGSLRAALAAEGPRVIVFEVAGVIDLGMETLRIREPFVTVAGETAPSPGITIIKGGISITSHDVVIRHLKVRPGDAGQAKQSGWEPDGMTTSGGEAYNVVIEHCSATWAVDENISVSGPNTEGPDATSHQVTIQHCIIAEGLDDAPHSKGKHSKGSLVHDFCRDIAIVGNLYAHNIQRNPYFKAFTTGAIVNNVIYNPGTDGVQLNYAASEWEATGIAPENPMVSIVGNVMLHGADTRPGLALVRSRGDAYLEDNMAIDASGQSVVMTSGEITVLPDRPVWPIGLTAHPSANVIDLVVKNVGARPWDRDAVDLKIIEDLGNRQGRVIDSQEEVGGYPVVEEVRRPLAVPTTDLETWPRSFELEMMSQE